MDASPAEQKAVPAYVSTLSNPFPMLEASNEVVVVQGQIAAFRHPEGAEPRAGQVWIVWPLANTGGATVEIPPRQPQVRVICITGESRNLATEGGRARLDLKGDAKMAAPPAGH